MGKKYHRYNILHTSGHVDAVIKHKSADICARIDIRKKGPVTTCQPIY